MNINLTDEVPELAFLVEYSDKIEQAKFKLKKLLDVQRLTAIDAIEALQDYETKHNIEFDEDLVIDYQGKQLLIKGLNYNEHEPLKVRPIKHVIHMKDKQTDGSGGEKETS